MTTHDNNLQSVISITLCQITICRQI